MKVKLCFQLFLTFFKIGLLAFGGGYAIIPLLQKETVERQKWITEEELMDMTTIAQTMPGIIFVNSATMVGYRVSGFFGALAATLSAVLPTFIMIIAITALFWEYTEHPLVKKAFTGILLGVTSLILYSITKMWKGAIKSSLDILMALLSVFLLAVLKINAAIVILVLTAVSFALNFKKIKLGDCNK